MSRQKLTPIQQKNLERTQWTDNELLIADIPDPDWVVPKYLPIGLTVLAGRPFIGKSFLALQLVGALRSGGMMFGERVRQSRCLYIACEDINSSFRKRILGQHWAKVPPPFSADVFTKWERFKAGGMEHLKKQLHSKEYSVCVIDSLYRLLTGSKKEKDGEMEPVMSELQDFYKKGIVEVMLPLVHNNKLGAMAGEGDESFISGDSAIAGVADNFWMITNDATTKKTHFTARGRSLERISMDIKFDSTTLAWQPVMAQDKIKQDSVRGLILTKFAEQARPLTATVLSELIGKAVQLIQRELQILESDELIERLPKHGVEVFYILKVKEKGVLAFLQ